MSQLLIWCCFFSPSCHDNSSTAPFISSGPGLHRQPFGLLQNVQGSIGESLTPLFCAIVYLSFQQFALKKKEQIRLRRRKKLCKNTSFPPEGGVQSTFAAAFWKERLFNAERLNEERSRASGSLPQITPQPAPRGRRRCRSDVWQGQQAPQGERRCAFGSQA